MSPSCHPGPCAELVSVSFQGLWFAIEHRILKIDERLKKLGVKHNMLKQQNRNKKKEGKFVILNLYAILTLKRIIIIVSQQW